VVTRKRGLLAGLAAALLSAAAGSPDIAAEFGKTRTLSLYNIHSKERIDVVYMRDGKRIPDAVEKINWMLRDWRKNESAKMDPELVDMLWEIHTELGSREPIHIISGFRSRETNEMLRKTVGGQASESQHIQAKAADVHFPDVPLKQLRYSALIRERGGVGYYPTSAIPFVHIDTSRVRHWPRLPRYELALLFPSGQTKHQPVDGGPITREDVKIAQSRHKELATQVAEFFSFRSQPKTLVADIGGKAAPLPAAVVAQAGLPPGPAPRIAQQQPQPPAPREQKVAALTPPPAPAAPPRLVAEPRLVERASRFTPRPSNEDKLRLDELVTLASYAPEPPPAAAPVASAAAPAGREPRLLAEPKPAQRPARRSADADGLTGGPPAGSAMPLPQFARPDLAERRMAALAPPRSEAQGRLSDALSPGWGSGFAAAPEYDEEHPDELSYRPFPVAPLLTASASPDDPVLAQLFAPDVARTLDLLNGDGAILPMRFHPGAQTARLLWAQEFKGGAVNLGMFGESAADEVPAGLARRTVKIDGR